MDVTLAIAIWGALTGSIAAIVNLRSIFLDRPRLVVRQEMRSTLVGQDRWQTQIVMTVSNEGRQPVVVDEADFCIAADEVRKGWRRKAAQTPVFRTPSIEEVEFPRTLRPGGDPLIRTLDADYEPFDRVPFGPTGFAIDQRGKTHWASPMVTARVLRDFRKLIQPPS